MRRLMFIAIVFVFFSCGKNEHEVQKILSGTWNIDQTAAPDNEPADAPAGGYFTFDDDGSGYLRIISIDDTIESDFYYNVTYFNNTQWFNEKDPAQDGDHIHAQSLSLYNINDYKPDQGVYRTINSDGIMYFRIAYVKKRKGILILYYDSEDNNPISYSSYTRQRTYYYCSLK